MNNDTTIPAFILTLSSFVIIGISMLLGSEISKSGYTTKGRNDGIIFCSENPDKCKIEYSYLKLKETKNEQ